MVVFCCKSEVLRREYVLFLVETESVMFRERERERERGVDYVFVIYFCD